MESTVSVIEQFPLLYAARQREHAGEAHDRMLALAGLTGTWLERFKAALQRRDTRDEREKMIDDLSQKDLGEIFATKIDDRGRQEGVHLAPEHFDDLKAQWPENLAFRLLCMAALYTNYASVHAFGTEEDSPYVLRLYAAALLRKAHELDPKLLNEQHPELPNNQDPGPPDNHLAIWVKKWRGEDNEFQCTSGLYNLQSIHLDALLRREPDDGALHRVWDEMIPVEWRDAEAPNPAYQPIMRFA